jgi:Tfp pilus assembly protein PilX
LKQTELFAQHTRLGANRRSRMLATTFAMAMARLNEWRINFKPNAATQATSANDFVHSQINSHASTSQQSQH